MVSAGVVGRAGGRVHYLGRAAMVVALLATAVPALAAADPPDVDVAGRSPLSMPVRTAVPVTLVTNTRVPYNVTITAREPDGANAAGPVEVDLDGGGLAIPGPRPAGTTGLLVAVAWKVGGSSVMARRSFRASAAGPWEPLVAEWQVTSYRGPVLHGLRNGSVPLADGASCGGAADVVVGGVARAGGGSAVVTATCRPGRTFVDLSVSGLGAAGDYTGTIDLAPDADGGELALTVRHTDDVVYPILLLLAGVALALVAAWQSGRLTTLSRTHEETWLIEADATAAHQRFRVAAEGRTWQAYSFLVSLRARLEAVRRQLRGLRWLISEIEVDKGPYKEQLDVLVELRELVDAWEPFAARLAALASARAAVADGPAIAAHADELLRGRELPEIGEVRPLVQDAEATESALLAWPADEHAVQTLIDLGNRLDALVPASRGQERLSRALARVEAIRDEMLAAKDGVTYAGLGVSARLEEPAAELAALRRQYGGVLSGRDGPLGTTGTAPPTRTADAPHNWDAAREAAAGMVRRIALSRRLRNALAFLAIAAVTVWTGLTALYFDQPFGTWRDYAAILVWAFAAQAGLTVLAGALDKIIAGGPVVRA
jgi:hypothetical protein